MKNNRQETGSVEIFDKDWKDRKEALYSHFTKSKPQNQIQLAFQQHYKLFSQVETSLNYNKGNRVLEVGCGRGSLSHYYARDNFKCSLLDSSSKAIDIAKNSFSNNNFSGEFYVGDALSMPFEDESFDIVFSIGLLEHFKDVKPPLAEQLRVLDRGGILHVYVVPKNSPKVNEEFDWINKIIHSYTSNTNSNTSDNIKEEVFRSEYNLEYYKEILIELGVEKFFGSGVYPLPMISHSPEFPFSLMPPQAELFVTGKFEEILNTRENKYSKNGWLCDEDYGQAFLISCIKPL